MGAAGATTAGTRDVDPGTGPLGTTANGEGTCAVPATGAAAFTAAKGETTGAAITDPNTPGAWAGAALPGKAIGAAGLTAGRAANGEGRGEDIAAAWGKGLPPTGATTAKGDPAGNPEGTWELQVRGPGWEKFSQEIQVKAGLPIRLAIRLNKASEPALNPATPILEGEIA
jgi:hypothetical protein